MACPERLLAALGYLGRLPLKGPLAVKVTFGDYHRLRVLSRVPSRRSSRTEELSSSAGALMQYKRGSDFMARPERFELPTTWFEARQPIQPIALIER